MKISDRTVFYRFWGSMLGLLVAGVVITSCTGCATSGGPTLPPKIPVQLAPAK